MSPAADRLLAIMAVEGYDVERDHYGYPQLVKRRGFMEGAASQFSQAVEELAKGGLVDVAANGSGSCCINDKGLAAAKVPSQGGLK